MLPEKPRAQQENHKVFQGGRIFPEETAAKLSKNPTGGLQDLILLLFFFFLSNFHLHKTQNVSNVPFCLSQCRAKSQ